MKLGSARSNITINKSLFFTLAIAAGAVSQTQFARANDAKVLIIDEGADLQHAKLKAFINENATEKTGTPGVDDDKNGFVDDVAGWNAVSNDASYMPGYVMDLFKQNDKVIKQALDLYSKVETGDKQAIDTINSNPNVMEFLSTLLEVSHGTHVAGIASKLSEGTAKLQNVNIFTPSTQPKDGGEDPSNPPSSPPTTQPIDNPGLETVASALSARPMATFGGNLAKTIRNFLADAPATRPTTQPTTQPSVAPTTQPARQIPPSFLDSKDQVDQLIQMIGEQNKAQSEVLVKYVSTVKPDAVNLSLGVSMIQVVASLDQGWKQELVERGLPTNTPRTAAQEANFRHLIDDVFAGQHAEWVRLFKSSPTTVFVVAAGNDGDANDASRGNLDINPMTPATASTEVDNVITVVATTQNGLIADFSNYSPRFANIGAWGVAVPSLAPNDNFVTMSGTSMAAPLVTGVVAKMRSLNAKLSPADVRKIIEGTGTQAGSLKGKTTSGAMINPASAYVAATAALNGLSVEAAIQAANQKATLPTPSFWMSNFESANANRIDVNSVGKVFKTSAEVKRFLRHY